jgi:hypothetical protein
MTVVRTISLALLCPLTVEWYDGDPERVMGAAQQYRFHIPDGTLPNHLPAS